MIQPDHKLCLGSYVFFWGQKQERTPTWYGMFLKRSEETAAIDIMHYFWTGAWPTNRSPRVEGPGWMARPLFQNVRLKPGQTYSRQAAGQRPGPGPAHLHLGGYGGEHRDARSGATPSRFPRGCPA